MTKKDPKALEVLEKLSDEQLAFVPEEPDGKAVYLSLGTEDDFKQFEKEEAGLAPWYERIKNLK